MDTIVFGYHFLQDVHYVLKQNIAVHNVNYITQLYSWFIPFYCLFEDNW